MNTVPVIVRAFGLALAAFAIFSTHAAQPHGEPIVRDWSKFPAVLRLTTTADVIAVGDVHGDYERLVQLLAANHVAEASPTRPDQVRWLGGSSILVCTGDMIDRWTNGLSVIRFFRALQVEAHQAGGAVIVTMGNHEAAFLTQHGPHHRTEEFERELLSARISPETVRQGADPEGLGQFLRSLPIAAVINDWCFVHAGNLQGRTLDQLEADLERSIAHDGFGAAILSDPDSVLEARLRPNPWWETGANGPAEAEAHLRAVVSAVGCRHLVTGHQPKGVVMAGGMTRQAGALASEFDGLLFLIDTGMSRGVGVSQGALLWIRTNQGAALVRSARGQVRELWRDNSHALTEAAAKSRAAKSVD